MFIKKPVSDNTTIKSLNYVQNDSALFLTTPKIILSDLNIFLSSSNDKTLLRLTEAYTQKTNDICFNADKIYGQKVLRMNESVFSGLFRHAEKVRIQNHVQEKMLHEAINGNKGIEKKLHQKLTKIERTRQSLEEELFYMEKEMKSLGLKVSKKKGGGKNSSTKQSQSQSLPAVDQFSSSTNDLSKGYFRQRSSLTNKSFDSVMTDNNSIERKDSMMSVTDLESISERKSSLKSDYKKYMRKGNSLVHFSHEPLHYTPKIRKYSLGNHHPPTSHHSSSLSKARSASIYASEPTLLFAKNSLLNATTNAAATSSSSDFSVFGGDQRSSSPPELLSTTKTSEPTVTAFSPRILQLPKIDQIYADRRKRSRKVSFTQVDLNELEIPKTYMHSNEALEKYKFNPNYYLPDGTLKTKFLLPQLKDSLEMAKKCRYIRQYSVDAGEGPLEGEDIVKYVFNDNQPPTIN